MTAIRPHFTRLASNLDRQQREARSSVAQVRIRVYIYKHCNDFLGPEVIVRKAHPQVARERPSELRAVIVSALVNCGATWRLRGAVCVCSLVLVCVLIESRGNMEKGAEGGQEGNLTR